MAVPESTRLRTRSPSPGRIFASSTTPILIDSSPMVFAAASTSKPRFEESTERRRPKVIEKVFTQYLAERQSGAPDALVSSPGRENLPIRPLQKPKCATNKDELLLKSDGNKQLTLDASPKQLSSSKRTKKTSGIRKAKKADGLVNKRLTGQITKALTIRDSKSAKDASKLPDENISFKDPGPDEVEWEIEIEAATKRRCDWTPVKDTIIPSIDLTVNLGSSPLSASQNGSQKFTSLLSGYGFTKDSTQSSDNGYAEECPTKKRRLELFPGTMNAVSEAGSNKAIQKGSSKQNRAKGSGSRKITSASTTITSIATAQYGRQDTSPSPSTVARLSKKAGERTKAKKSRPKKNENRKVKEMSMFRVAPAEDALKSLEDQVYLFGTSSQLESTSLNQDSFGIESNSLTSFPCDNSLETDPSSSLVKFKASKGLWSAGCRDLDGSVADVEVVDLVDSDAPRTLKSLVISRPVTSATDSTRVTVSQGGLDDASKASQVASRATESTISETCQLSMSKLITDFPESAQHDISQENHPMLVGENSEHRDAREAMPNFLGLTTAELTQKVVAFGFRPLKNREKMISLLEKCWESQHRASTPISFPLGNQKSSASVTESQKKGGHGTSSKQPSIKPKRPSGAILSSKPILSTSQESTYGKIQPGRKKEHADASDGDSVSTLTESSSKRIVVIPDSDDSDHGSWEDVIPGILNHSKLMDRTYTSTSSTDFVASASSLSIRTRPGASTQTEAPNSPNMNEQITKAIRAQPRMAAIDGVKRPTWLEKILMYDPIWLDGLTSWLNTEGLGRVGEGRKVSRFTVREWCEGKGICCTWRRT
ncbi:5'-flap endonuclease [Emydomyces testavorans]|uniref:Structure-specific endonuclease subunit SLX4 n=1 Tax=Emydomyces testavorans TaxID=2070801 RepID=A0AAF0IJQ5_9EURO|nr:5'-flap endonuclease [Emydomyces testavorans]